MGTALAMLKKMAQVNLFAMAADIIDNNREAIADINREQLHQGLNRFGRPLSPKYSEDPYFTTAAAAKAYADWKHRLFPDTPYDTPNLIINGYFHSSISMRVVGDSARFEASASFAKSIEGKYNNSALGLNEGGKTEAFNTIIRPPLVRRLADKLGVNTSK